MPVLSLFEQLLALCLWCAIAFPCEVLLQCLPGIQRLPMAATGILPGFGTRFGPGFGLGWGSEQNCAVGQHVG